MGKDFGYFFTASQYSMWKNIQNPRLRSYSSPVWPGYFLASLLLDAPKRDQEHPSEVRAIL
jgi:hypothetical protein